MKRFWNTLLYGDWETRKCIGSVMLFAVLALGLMIASGVTAHGYLFIFGLIAGVISLLISRSFTLVNDDFVAETGADGEKESVKAVTVQKDSKKTEGLQKEDIADDKPVKSGSEQEKMLPHAGKSRLKEEAVQEETVQEEDDVRYARYSKQELVRIKKKYRVRKDHRPILIDNSKTFHIKECPAFIWRGHKKVFLLLLEKEPRKITISRNLIRHMGYASDVQADYAREYRAFQKKNLITSVFGEYQPDYFDPKPRDVKSKKLHIQYKHLYTIYPDIQISNRCAAEVMDLLCLNFMPEDKITRSEKINGYFKRIYAAYILFRDRVYSAVEYKKVVENTLEELCYAEMPEEEFVITLENLVSASLISQRYADCYIEVKSKISRKKVKKSYRR